MRPTLFQPAGFQLAATFLLAIVPVISATPSPLQLSPKGVGFRDLKPPNMDDGWVGLGCYMDDPFQPTLTSVFTSDPKMTATFCVSTCDSAFTNLAGVVNGNECRCGNVTTAGAMPISPSVCKIECPGNSGQTCGGSYAIAIYGSGKQQQHPAAIPHDVGPWSFSGCFNDSDTARVLSVPKDVIGGKYNNTVQNCINACGAAGFYYAGMEDAEYCWCDNQINQDKAPIDESSCILPCPGNNLEICGGLNSLVIYKQAQRGGS